LLAFQVLEELRQAPGELTNKAQVVSDLHVFENLDAVLSRDAVGAWTACPWPCCSLG
jgi:hypothetical protein